MSGRLRLRAVFHALRRRWAQLWLAPLQSLKALPAESDGQVAPPELLPHNPQLLEQARLQWQFGDWSSLAELDENQIRHHRDAAQIACLVIGARLQLGHRRDEVQALIQLAQDKGVAKQTLARMLIAGAHNTLGRASAIAGRDANKTLAHLHAALTVGMPQVEARLLARPRIERQLTDLALPPAQSQAALLAALDVDHPPTLAKPRSRLRRALAKRPEQSREQAHEA